MTGIIERNAKVEKIKPDLFDGFRIQVLAGSGYTTNFLIPYTGNSVKKCSLRENDEIKIFYPPIPLSALGILGQACANCFYLDVCNAVYKSQSPQ